MKELFACLSFLMLGCATTLSADPKNQFSIVLTEEAPKEYVVDGKILFEKEVTRESVDSFLAELKAEEAAPNATEVEITIDTPGGSVLAGIDMGKALERSKLKSVCKVDGMAASMGFYILQSCSVREMTARSLLMGHEPSAGTRGNQNDAANLSDLLHALNIAMGAHITHRSQMTTASYLHAIAGGRELWLDADTALVLGFVDSIVL